MNIQNAKEIQITEYLAHKGFRPIRYNNSSDYWYLSPLRTENTASFKVSSVLNRWFDHGIGEGGNIIDLSLRLGSVDIKNALKDISGVLTNSFSFQQPTNIDTSSEQEINPANIKILKEQTLQNKALIQYAENRGIKEEVAKKFCIEIYYQILSTGKNYFSLGVKTDTGGIAMRNKYFKTAVTPCGITTISSRSNKLKVFEGFFDFLSYKVLFPGEVADFVILNSIIYINQAEAKFQNYDMITLFLDNDPAGLLLRNMLKEKYGGSLNSGSEVYNGFKDLNDFLVKNK